MKLILAAALAVAAFSAHASPFLVSDPYSGTIPPGATLSCGIYMDAAAKVVSPTVGSACHYDIATLAPGQHTVTATFILVDPVQGTLESAQSTPLAFTRLAAPTAPANVKLAP